MGFVPTLTGESQTQSIWFYRPYYATNIMQHSFKFLLPKTHQKSTRLLCTSKGFETVVQQATSRRIC